MLRCILCMYNNHRVTVDYAKSMPLRRVAAGCMVATVTIYCGVLLAEASLA